MGELYDLIHDAHRTARDRNNGEAVRYITLEVEPTVGYKGNPRIGVWAAFNPEREHLKTAHVTLIDNEASQLIQEDEIRAIAGHMESPIFLGLQGYVSSETSGTQPRIGISMERIGEDLTSLYITDTTGYAPDEGKTPDYEGIAERFGLRLDGARSAEGLKLGGILQHEALATMRELFDAGLSSAVFMQEEEGKYIQMIGDCVSMELFTPYTLINNYVTFGDTEMTAGALSRDAVDKLEDQLSYYRDTGLYGAGYTLLTG